MSETNETADNRIEERLQQTAQLVNRESGCEGAPTIDPMTAIDNDTTGAVIGAYERLQFEQAAELIANERGVAMSVEDIRRAVGAWLYVAGRDFFDRHAAKKMWEYGPFA